MTKSHPARDDLVARFGLEGGLLYDVIRKNIADEFLGLTVTPEALRAIYRRLSELTALGRVPLGELEVTHDPADPTRVIITGTGEYADWLRRAQDQGACP